MARYNLQSLDGVRRDMAKRAKKLRLLRNVTQARLAERADISQRSLQRFEATGDGSIQLLIAIAFALRAEGAFESLFQGPGPSSMDEFLADTTEKRKRASGSKRQILPLSASSRIQRLRAQSG